MRAFWHRHGWLLLILAVAALLRFWALPFGLPNLTRPDEQNIAQVAVMGILNSFFRGHPSLNPHFFFYPSLFIYLLTALYACYYTLGHWLGLFPDWKSFIALYLNDWGSFLLIARCLGAVFGVLGVWAMTRLGTVFFRSRLFGLLSGALLAVTYLHVRDSHFGVTDVATAFWITAALWQTLEGFERRDTGALRRAAILAGLAASTKYPAGLALLPVLLALAHVKRQEGGVPRGSWDKGDKGGLIRPGVSLIAWCLGAFLLTSPFVLLDFGTFLEHFRTQQISFRTLYAGNPDLQIGYFRYFTFAFRHGLGAVYLLSSLLGLALLLWRDRGRAALLLAYAVPFYLGIGNTQSAYVRYVIPLVPVMALLATEGLRWAWVSLNGRFRLPVPAWPALLLSLLWLLVAGQSINNSVRFDRLLGMEDTRSQARSWLLARLKPGDGVGIGRPLSHIDLPAIYNKLILVVPDRGEAASGMMVPVPVPRARLQAANPWRSEWNINTYTDAEALRALRVRYLEVAETPLKIYRTDPLEAAAIAASPDYRLAARFSAEAPGQVGPPESAYDRIDGFFVPFSRFDGLERPGPTILIYEVLPARKK